MHFSTLNPVKIRKILACTCKLLFKRMKELEVHELRYTHRYLFSQSYLVIQCRCNNALWLSIHGYGVFTGEHIVLNIHNLANKSLRLTVRGLFSRQAFYLEVRPKWLLRNNTFKTAINQWYIPAAFIQQVQPVRAAVSVIHKKISCPPAISVKVKPVIYLPSSFNSADYI
jgi:hypothetical protein